MYPNNENNGNGPKMMMMMTTTTTTTRYKHRMVGRWVVLIKAWYILLIASVRINVETSFMMVSSFLVHRGRTRRAFGMTKINKVTNNNYYEKSDPWRPQSLSPVLTAERGCHRRRRVVLNAVKVVDDNDDDREDHGQEQHGRQKHTTANGINNKYNVSLLLIDHYDSFTYNLYDMLAQLTVEPPVVIAKDSPNLNITMMTQFFDGIILSPGPGWPHDQPSLPLLQDLTKNHPTVPVLGVCLGHQMLALTYGARVDKSPEPIHGQDHWIRCASPQEQQQQEGELSSPSPNIFQNLPTSFRVVRYHSLCAYMDGERIGSFHDDGGDDHDHDKFKIPLVVTARTVDRNNNNNEGRQHKQSSTSSNMDRNNEDGDDGTVIQAIQHVKYPHYGVQFHPESIGTQHGIDLLENFVKVVHKNKYQHKEEVKSKTNSVAMPGAGDSNDEKEQSQTDNELIDDVEERRRPRFRTMIHKYTPVQPSADETGEPYSLTPLQVFEHFYNRGEILGDDEEAQSISSSLGSRYAVWLDSSSYSTSERGTVDIIAAPTRPKDIIEHFSRSSSSTKNDADDSSSDDSDIMSKLETRLYGPRDGTDSSRSFDNTNDTEWVINMSGHGAEGQDRDRLWIVDREEDKGTTGFRNRADLPFHYRGGLIGYLGYEIRHETQKYLQEQQGVSKADKISEPEISESTSCTQPQDGNKIPSAAFFLARQSMLFHHPTQTWYLIALVEDDSTNDIDENLRWMEDVRIQFKALGLASAPVSISKVRPDFRSPESKKRLEFALKRPKEIYERNIAECHEFIRMGESYELCLTTQLEADVCCIGSTSFDLYRTLRLRNPAPYSAYFRWNANERGSPEESGLVICSSSPEQFMSVTRQQPHPEIEPFFMAEAKPIKGTCARVLPQNGICRTDAEWREDERRARSLELSLKNRAENLMIVDLLRNDLSRVCKVGSVYVAKLMDIESFATVHQMVSTIRGTLSDTATPIDLLRASFPGGSMTGAPKIRTMELLDELEQGQPRGPYSGSLGYLSVNGCMSFNIIIRSAVLTPKWVSGSKGWHVSIGAGGAITALSEVQDEYDEMNLKAKAVVSAVQEWESTSTLSAVDHEESLPSSRQSQLMDTTGAGPSTT